MCVVASLVDTGTRKQRLTVTTSRAVFPDVTHAGFGVPVFGEIERRTSQRRAAARPLYLRPTAARKATNIAEQRIVVATRYRRAGKVERYLKGNVFEF